MPEDSPGAFSLYVDWLYRGTITLGNTEEYILKLYELCILAEKPRLTDLKDKTMDAVQDMALKYKLKEELITVDLVTKVLLNTRSKHDGLRKFLPYQMAFVYLGRYLEDQEKDLESENEYETDPGVAEEQEIDAMAYVLRKDMKKVYEIAMNCKSFRFLDFFFCRLMKSCKAEPISDLLDPRIRDEEDTYDRCFFHCHKKDYNWRPAPAAEAKDTFIRLDKQSTAPSTE